MDNLVVPINKTFIIFITFKELNINALIIIKTLAIFFSINRQTIVIKFNTFTDNQLYYMPQS